MRAFLASDICLTGTHIVSCGLQTLSMIAQQSMHLVQKLAEKRYSVGLNGHSTTTLGDMHAFLAEDICQAGTHIVILYLL